MTEERAHADAGPSSSHAWLHCPAFVTKTRGRHRKSTPYTREGSAAHYVAESIIKGVDVPAVVAIEDDVVAVTTEMLDHVGTYVSLAETLRYDATLFLVEERVSLNWFFAPMPMPEPVFGTADLIVYNEKTRTLTVVDLKYGAGHAVDAAGNPQLRIYALGALALVLGQEVRTVRTVIVQPRAAGEPIKSETISIGELLEWANNELRPAIHRIGAGDTTETTGEWCRWCVRAGECASLHARAMSAARMTFGAVTPPTPSSLSNEELGEILREAEIIATWVSKVRAEVSGRIDNGQAVPGWKLVAKRGNRKWSDETAAVLELNDILDPDDMFEPMKMRSPAKIEKALKNNGLDPKVIEPFVIREASGSTLVRETDERKAVDTSAASVFDPVVGFDG